jgi:diadenosine tetraphosphate (Ap4A) HIT family hydrolase
MAIFRPAKEPHMTDRPTPEEAAALPRRPMDAQAYERRSRGGPCFVCEMLAGNPGYPGDLVWADDHAVAFLARYNTLLGHTLVVPRAHREQVTGDFRIEEYLSLQRLVYHVGEALRDELPTERLYIMSLGSQSGNRHVHWHVAPLPPGVLYEHQQLAAFSWDRGVLALPEEDMAALARRIGARVEARQHAGRSVG